MIGVFFFTFFLADPAGFFLSLELNFGCSSTHLAFSPIFRHRDRHLPILISYFLRLETEDVRNGAAAPDINALFSVEKNPRI